MMTPTRTSTAWTATPAKPSPSGGPSASNTLRTTAAAASLDETGTRQSTGEPISLRKITVDMIAEYARHNGHADLLRERIDGATGL